MFYAIAARCAQDAFPTAWNKAYEHFFLLVVQLANHLVQGWAIWHHELILVAVYFFGEIVKSGFSGFSSLMQ